MSFFPAWLRAALITLTGLGLLVWLLWRALKKSYDPPALLTRMILTGGLLLAGYFSVDSVASDGSAAGSIGGVLLGLIFGLLLAFVWVPVVVNKVSDAIGSLWTGGAGPPPPPPPHPAPRPRGEKGKIPPGPP